MPGRGTETRSMTGQVLVRLVPDLFARLGSAAAEAGLTAPAFVRQLIVRALAAAPADARPSTPRTPIAVDAAEVSRLVRAVGRSNGAMVQLSKCIRESGGDNSEVESVLTDARAVQADLVRFVAGGLHAGGRDTR